MRGEQRAQPASSAAAALLRDRARSLRHPLTRTLLVLTFTAGLIDAVSFLGVGHVFTANMTGNVVLLGFGIAGSGGLPLLAPLVSLAAFLLGAAAGGLIAVHLAERHPQHLAFTLAIELALVAAAAATAAGSHLRPDSAPGYAVIVLLALAMGTRSATVRRIAVPDLSTTVLTMTLTGLASDLPLFGGSERGAMRRGTATLAMLVGALIGALLLRQSAALPLALAAALALAGLLAYPPAERRAQATRTSR